MSEKGRITEAKRPAVGIVCSTASQASPRRKTAALSNRTVLERKGSRNAILSSEAEPRT